MKIVTLKTADNAEGCPFPFFEDNEPSSKLYKIYNDGGHYIATELVGKQKEQKEYEYSQAQVNALKMTKEKHLDYLVEMSKKRKADRRKKKRATVLDIDLSKKNVSSRTGLDILFDSLYFEAKKQGLRDTKTDKPMTEFIKAGILKLYENSDILDEAIHKFADPLYEEVFPDIYTLDGYISRKIKRKENNLIYRKKLFRRKAYMNKWNYFVTFTYDDKKQTEESFKKKLRKCLSNLHTRRGWKYMGVFEKSPEKERLHFHGLLYIPHGQMIGNIKEKQDYSFATGRMQERSENSFFEEAFGRNDFCELSMNELRNGKRIEYILKYIGKTKERICYSRGIPAQVCKEIKDIDIVTEMRDFVRKFILFDDVIDWENDVMKRNKRKETKVWVFHDMPLLA